MTTKYCGMCKTTKDISEFYKSKTTYDNLQWKCKDCFKKHYEINKEKIHKYKHENYMSKRDKLLKKAECYRLENRDDILKWKRQYSIDHHDKIIISRKKYSNSDGGKITKSKNHHIRRSKINNLPLTLTSKQWNKILISQNNKCDDCGKKFSEKLKPTKDHIIPISSNRIDAGFTFENIRAICGSCNSKKHGKIDKELIQSWINYI